MAFSKGKRIEDETSQRIIDLAVHIGCVEGPGALTVTRICRELNCDRRVIYNRFRDIDEINLIVAGRCNDELLRNARNAMKEEAGYYENLIALVQAEFTYIYEKNAFFRENKSTRSGAFTVLLLLKKENIKEHKVYFCYGRRGFGPGKGHNGGVPGKIA